MADNPYISELVEQVNDSIRMTVTAHTYNEKQAEELFQRYRQLFINQFIDSLHEEGYKKHED